MKLALTQMNPIWENPEQNAGICESLVKEAVQNNADIIVFPELTLTGFTMNPDRFAENPETGFSHQFFTKLSKRYGIAIVYGRIAKGRKKALNLMEMVEQNRLIFQYAKLHPFSYGGESLHYERGDKIVSGSFQGVPVGGFICYDLRFPEVFQISSKENTLLFVIANWPESRVEQWYALLKARAIENQCYIVGVNRTGEGGGLSYTHSSAAFDPYGTCLVSGMEDRSTLLYTDCHTHIAEIYRKEFPVRRDRIENFYKIASIY